MKNALDAFDRHILANFLWLLTTGEEGCPFFLEYVNKLREITHFKPLTDTKIHHKNKKHLVCKYCSHAKLNTA